MKTKSAADKGVRTTVSLAGVVWEMAVDLMVADGFNGNFSALVADLVRRAKEQKDAARILELDRALALKDAASKPAAEQMRRASKSKQKISYKKPNPPLPLESDAAGGDVLGEIGSALPKPQTGKKPAK